MPATEAQIKANRENALKSTGPKTSEGKEASRRNSFKHGMTGEGIVLPNEDLAEVEHRLKSFRDEFRPSGAVDEALTRRAAVLSVRLDRCVSHETASLSSRIRQAEADFVAPEGANASEVAQLKAEAKALAMFDPSKDASMARRYEAAAERGFFRALKELRQLEAHRKQQAEAAEPAPYPDDFDDILASFSQLQQANQAIQARVANQPIRTSSNPRQQPVSPSFSPAAGVVDVPFTIGRPR